MAAKTVFRGVDEVRAAVGRHLGHSDWTEVTQQQVSTFADATGDHQWVYLTLALTNLFLPQVVDVQGVSLGVNRGTGKVRFPAPAPVGSRLRAGVELVAVDEVPGGIDTTMVITVEREGSDKPVCVVESLSRYLA